MSQAHPTWVSSRATHCVDSWRRPSHANQIGDRSERRNLGHGPLRSTADSITFKYNGNGWVLRWAERKVVVFFIAINHQLQVQVVSCRCSLYFLISWLSSRMCAGVRTRGRATKNIKKKKRSGVFLFRFILLNFRFMFWHHLVKFSASRPDTYNLASCCRWHFYTSSGLLEHISPPVGHL